MPDAMEAIAPTTSNVTFRGERLEIQPLTVGAVPKIVRLARPVIDAVLDLEALPDEHSGEMVNLALDMIDKHGDALFQAVALAIGRDREFVEGGDIGDFVDLCKTLVEVNRDFFVRRLGPLLAERARARSGSGDGKTPSSSSSNAATH